MKSWWSNARRTAFEKIGALFGVTRGQILPKPLLVITCLLFPSRALLMLCEKVAPIGYDLSWDALKIGNWRFARESLIALANYPEGTLFKVERKDGKLGLITIQIVSPLIVFDGNLPEPEDLWPGKIIRNTPPLIRDVLTFRELRTALFCAIYDRRECPQCHAGFTPDDATSIGLKKVFDKYFGVPKIYNQPSEVRFSKPMAVEEYPNEVHY